MASKQYFREKYSQPATTNSKEYFKEKYTPTPQPKVRSMKTEGPAIESPGLSAPFVPMSYSQAMKEFQAQKDIEKAHLDMLEKQKQSNANMRQVLANLQREAGTGTQGPSIAAQGPLNHTQAGNQLSLSAISAEALRQDERRKVSNLESYIKTEKGKLTGAQRQGFEVTPPEIDLLSEKVKPLRKRVEQQDREELSRLLAETGYNPGTHTAPGKTPEEILQIAHRVAELTKTNPYNVFGEHFGDGLALGLPSAFIPEFQSRLEEQQQFNPSLSTKGNLTGSLAAQGALYGTIGKLAEQGTTALASKFLPNVLSNPVGQFAVNLLGQQAADTAIQTPLAIAKAVAKGENAKGVVTEVLKQQGGDLAANLLMMGGEGAIKAAGRKMDHSLNETFDNLVKVPKTDITPLSRKTPDQLQKEIESFARQVDVWQTGKIKKSAYFNLGATSDALQEAGAKDLPVIMSQKVMKKVVASSDVPGGKHGLGVELIKNLPQQLNDPIMILKSATQPNSLVVVTDMVDKEGRDIISAVALDVTQKHTQVNAIASVYGRNNANSFIKKQLGDERLRWINKEKAASWFQSRGLQLPKEGTTSGSSVSSIRQTAENINPSATAKTGAATWKNKEFDQPVTVIEEAGEMNGRRYVKIAESNAAIPADEVSFGPNTVGAAQSTFKHEQKVSRVRSNTIENSPMFSTAEKSMLDPEGFKYDVVTEKQSLREAKQRLQVDFDGEVEFLNKARALDGTDLDTAMGVLEQYRREAQGTPPNSPEWKRFKDWSKSIQEKGTSAGQFSQAFAKYSRTPEGAVIKAEKYVGDKVRDMKKKDPAFFNAMEDVADQLAKLAEEYQYELPADPQMAAKKLRQAVEEISRKHKKLKLDDDFADTVLQMIQDSQSGKTRFSAVLKEFENIPSITDNDLMKIMDYMAEAEKYPEFSKIRQGLENQAFKIVADKFPASWNEKANAWRYMSMLTNPTTHIRNVAGNAMFGKVTQVKNQIGALIEGTVDRTNRAFGGKGIERTKTLLNPMNPSDRALRQAVGDDFETVYALVTGGGKYNPTRVIEDNKTIFKNRALESVRKFNSNALEWEDSIALRARYKENLSRYLKANGYDAGIFKDTSLEAQNALNNARLYAIDQAKKATFRDDSALANWLNSGKHLKGVNALIEGAIPFKKTPINIVKRGAGYSPIGLTKGLYDMLWSVRKGTKTAAQAIDDIAAGLTGTAIMGIGAWMAASGLLSGAASENSKERSFEALQGAQNYALTIDDKSYTLDWAAPAALPLFVGVEIWNTFSGKNGDMTLGDILNALTAIGEPALEMTMLQGLNSTIRTAAYDQTSAVAGIATNAIANYASQFIPTILGKDARIADPVRRTTYIDKNSWVPVFAQRPLQKAMAKVPLMSSFLPPKVDQWGREQQNIGNSPAQRLFYNMLSPGYYSQTNSTPVDQEISRLYQLGGDPSVLPGTAPKQATIDGTRYNLTSDEYTQYAKTRGKSAFEMVDEMIRSGYYDHLSDSQKIDAIIKAYEISNDLSKSEFASGRGVNYEANGGMEKAIIKAAIKAAEGKKDREGKTVPGSVKEAQIKAIQELGYTRGEAEKLFKKYR